MRVSKYCLSFNFYEQLKLPYLNNMDIMVAVCESWPLFFVPSWCVGLIGLFLCGSALQWLGSLSASFTCLCFNNGGVIGRGFGAGGVCLPPSPPPVFWAAVRSGAVVVDLLLIVASIVRFCVCSIFTCSCALLCVLVLIGKRGLFALLCLPGVL